MIAVEIRGEEGQILHKVEDLKIQYKITVFQQSFNIFSYFVIYVHLTAFQ